MHKILLPYSLILFVGLFLSLNLQATHIVGGEMTYTCLGNDQYEIELTIFRDCYNGNPAAYFDNPAKIGIYNANSVLIDSLFIPFDLMLDDTLNPVLSDPCLVVPPNVCVHTTHYSGVVTLPVIPGGYQLIYQRCCRNMTIVNIVDPLATGATFGVNISENALNECNSSAKFTQWPPIYICVNEPINFDQSAIDADGDSIVYRLCTPLDGATPPDPEPIPSNQTVPNPVVWVDPPYNESDMLGGIPLAINEQTGWLTGTPNTIGQFVVGICLEEYRNGVLISTTRRDFQYNVGVCGETISSFFAPEIVCDGLEVSFSNESINANNYEWYFNDPANPGFFSTEESPTYTYSDTGAYTIMLIAEPGNQCVDTSYQDIFLQVESLFAEFDYEFIGCTDSLIIEVTDLTYDTLSTIESWYWELSTQTQGVIATSTEQNPTFTLTTNSLVLLSLTVTAENGCVKTLEQTFPANIFSSDVIPDEIINCLGDSTELNPMPQPGATYQWSPADGLSDPNAPNPLASPDMTTIYSVFVTNQFGCELYDTVQVTVIDDLPFVGAFANPDTINVGGTSQLEATFDDGYIYEWSDTDFLDDPFIYNPVATLDETTEFTVTVTDENGCTNTAVVRVVVLDPPCIEPNIFLPNAFTPNNDGENDQLRLLGRGIDEMYLAIYNRWGQKVFESNDPNIGWDGTFKGEDLEPDVYGFYLHVRCFNGEDFFKKGNIALLR